MSNVRPILTPAPPAVLYHYTTAAGALGIFGSKEIWASHTQYLNDQEEFRHAVSTITGQIEKLESDAEHRHQRATLRSMAAALERSESTNVCVCSFSEAADSLPQWRAYGHGSGFALGFDGAFLKLAAERLGYWLVKCIYDPKQQREWMRLLIKDVLKEVGGPMTTGAGHAIAGDTLVDKLNRYAPILKHKSFKDEREWRIITRPLSNMDASLRFRAGASLLIPYCSIPLEAAGAPFDLKKIVVGPTPLSRQSRKSVQSLIARYGLTSAVINTKAPYRHW